MEKNNLLDQVVTIYPAKFSNCTGRKAFSKVKFDRSRNIFLTDFITFLFFLKINRVKSHKILSKIIIFEA
jgi:hypothetical protein